MPTSLTAALEIVHRHARCMPPDSSIGQGLREAIVLMGKAIDSEEEIQRCYKVLLNRRGATTIEPIDVIIDRMVTELEAAAEHHAEHHDREARLESQLRDVHGLKARRDETCEPSVHAGSGLLPVAGEAHGEAKKGDEQRDGDGDHADGVASDGGDATDGTAPERALLHRFVDHETDPCRLDHHGYCQAHPGAQETGQECAVAEGRRMLATRPPDGMPGEPARCVAFEGHDGCHLFASTDMPAARGEGQERCKATVHAELELWVDEDGPCMFVPGNVTPENEHLLRSGRRVARFERVTWGAAKEAMDVLGRDAMHVDAGADTKRMTPAQLVNADETAAAEMLVQQRDDDDETYCEPYACDQYDGDPGLVLMPVDEDGVQVVNEDEPIAGWRVTFTGEDTWDNRDDAERGRQEYANAIGHQRSAKYRRALDRIYVVLAELEPACRLFPTEHRLCSVALMCTRYEKQPEFDLRFGRVEPQVV